MTVNQAFMQKHAIKFIHNISRQKIEIEGNSITKNTSTAEFIKTII